MYIQPCDNNVNMQGLKDWPNYIKRLGQRAWDALPNATINDSAQNCARWDKIKNKISRPAENRLIMGATAMVTQPLIDYNNPKVDKETREISRNRTIAKIIAGTTAGILVRGSAQAIIESMTKINAKSRLAKALLAPKHIESFLKTSAYLSNYKNTLSTILAILAMCVTNFVIDAPLTVFLTNHLNNRTRERKYEEMKRREINE